MQGVLVNFYDAMALIYNIYSMVHDITVIALFRDRKTLD